MKTHLLNAVAVALLIAAPAQATDIAVKDGWFRALPGNLPAGGYFTLHNGGAKAVTLTGAESPACGMLMLHKTDKNGGTAMMMDMPSIKLAAGSDLVFSPGDYHLMCMDPTPAMKPGATVPVTLDFADGTKATSNFAVKNARGQ